MDRALCFCKTGLGQEEIQQRKLGLSQKLRQMLIMVDGQKSVADLEQCLPGDELMARLEALLGQGLIAPVAGSASPAAAAKPAPAPAAAPAAPIAMPTGLPSAGKLAQIRIILAMCSQQYLSDALDTMLIDLYDNMSGPEDLKFCIDTWKKRMDAAGYGSVADSHMPQIRAALR